MSDDRQAYAARRAREEHGLAAASTDERVRDIHLEMAIRYEIVAEGGAPALGDDEPD